MIELSRAEARRLAVRAQLLDADRPTGLHEVVRRLTLLQIDPTAAIAPNADLVAWSRLGSPYTKADLEVALRDRTLLELRAMIRPAEDLALYRADMAEWPGRGEPAPWRRHQRDWVEANDACRRDILRRLASEGPLTSRDLPEPAVVEGVRGRWRVDPALLDLPFCGRAALLSPFDRLIHDRKRTIELFEFDYQLEMYKPAAKRRWGYFALPILYGDRLVGKLDASARSGELQVHTLHQDVEFTGEMTEAVQREIDELTRWLNEG